MDTIVSITLPDKSTFSFNEGDFLSVFGRSRHFLDYLDRNFLVNRVEILQNYLQKELTTADVKGFREIISGSREKIRVDEPAVKQPGFVTLDMRTIRCLCKLCGLVMDGKSRYVSFGPGHLAFIQMILKMDRELDLGFGTLEILRTTYEDTYCLKYDGKNAPLRIFNLPKFSLFRGENQLGVIGLFALRHKDDNWLCYPTGIHVNGAFRGRVAYFSLAKAIDLVKSEHSDLCVSELRPVLAIGEEEEKKHNNLELKEDKKKESRELKKEESDSSSDDDGEELSVEQQIELLTMLSESLKRDVQRGELPPIRELGESDDEEDEIELRATKVKNLKPSDLPGLVKRDPEIKIEEDTDSDNGIAIKKKKKSGDARRRMKNKNRKKEDSAFVNTSAENEATLDASVPGLPKIDNVNYLKRVEHSYSITVDDNTRRSWVDPFIHPQYHCMGCNVDVMNYRTPRRQGERNSSLERVCLNCCYWLCSSSCFEKHRGERCDAHRTNMAKIKCDDKTRDLFSEWYDWVLTGDERMLFANLVAFKEIMPKKDVNMNQIAQKFFTYIRLRTATGKFRLGYSISILS